MASTNWPRSHEIAPLFYYTKSNRCIGFLNDSLKSTVQKNRFIEIDLTSDTVSSTPLGHASVHVTTQRHFFYDVRNCTDNNVRVLWIDILQMLIYLL